MYIPPQYFVELEERNRAIAAQRREAYEDLLDMPLYLTIHDILREHGETYPDFNLAVLGDNGWIVYDNIFEMVSAQKVNIGKNDLYNILAQRRFQNYEVQVGQDYLPVLKAYYAKFC